MKRLFLVILFLTVSLTVVACQKKEIRNAPVNQLSFLLEDDPQLIGSYLIERENLGQKWIETGSWTPVEAVIGREIVCFGYFTSGGYGTFRARSDYHWIEIQYDSRNTKCLELVKRK